MSERAKTITHIENERTRVTEYRFAPGAHTGWHRHEHDYVIVPLCDGRLRLESASGEVSEAGLSAGVAYFRAAGVEHDVTSDNAHELRFVEVELKR